MRLLAWAVPVQWRVEQIYMNTPEKHVRHVLEHQIDQRPRPLAHGLLGAGVGALLVIQHERKHLFFRPGQQCVDISRRMAHGAMNALCRKAVMQRLRPFNPVRSRRNMAGALEARQRSFESAGDRP